LLRGIPLFVVVSKIAALSDKNKLTCIDTSAEPASESVERGIRNF